MEPVTVTARITARSSATFLEAEPAIAASLAAGSYGGTMEVGGRSAPTAFRVIEPRAGKGRIWCQPRGPLGSICASETATMMLGAPICAQGEKERA